MILTQKPRLQVVQRQRQEVVQKAHIKLKIPSTSRYQTHEKTSHSIVWSHNQLVQVDNSTRLLNVTKEFEMYKIIILKEPCTISIDKQPKIFQIIINLENMSEK